VALGSPPSRTGVVALEGGGRQCYGSRVSQDGSGCTRDLRPPGRERQHMGTGARGSGAWDLMPSGQERRCSRSLASETGAVALRGLAGGGGVWDLQPQGRRVATLGDHGYGDGGAWDLRSLGQDRRR